LVVACEEIPDSPFHTVKTDNAYAAEQATRHLIDLGHRRIAHVRGPDDNVLTGERQRGFEAAMAQAGLPLRPEWLLKGGFDMESGRAAAAAFLALPDRPTAVFTANDEGAIGFLTALRGAGIECPRDISVVGFDDIALAQRYVPALPTAPQPCAAVGRRAAQALIVVIEGEPRSRVPRRMVLSSDLIIRDSTAPLH